MWQIFRRPDKKNTEYFTVLQDLQRSTGRSILLSIFTVCLVVFFAVVITSPFSWTFWLVMGIALSSCAASYLLLNRSIWISHIMLIAGLMSAIGLAMVYFPIPQVILLCAFLPMLSATTVGWQAAIATEAAVLGLFFTISSPLRVREFPQQYFLFLVTGGLLGALLGWSSIRSLFTIVSWSTYHYEQAQQNMQEARRHRGHMAQALKNLDLAYYRLERSNAALAAAWSTAEEAERFKKANSSPISATSCARR